MDEILIAAGAAWRRANARHHYAGSLWGSPTGLRLTGRDAATGIEVTLSIPVGQIEAVHVSNAWDERVAGEQSVVLELADSVAILVREVGTDKGGPDALAQRLGALVEEAAVLPPPAHATEGGDSP